MNNGIVCGPAWNYPNPNSPYKLITRPLALFLPLPIFHGRGENLYSGVLWRWESAHSARVELKSSNNGLHRVHRRAGWIPWMKKQLVAKGTYMVHTIYKLIRWEHYIISNSSISPSKRLAGLSHQSTRNQFARWSTWPLWGIKCTSVKNVILQYDFVV